MAAPLALVTGGHRRLGAVIAATLASAGYALAIHGGHDGEPDAALATTFAHSGTDWAGFAADFARPGAAEALFDRVCSRFGRAPDLLVNGASLFGQDRLDSVEDEDLAAHFAVNSAAPALLTRAFAGAVRQAGGDPSIINILDQRLSHPHGEQLAYTLSKGALATLTQASARALAPHVRVNAVAPGLVLPTQDYASGQTDRLARMMPLHRLPRPEEVADAVLFLAGARSVTGQVIHVDGGAGMQSWSADFLNLARD